MDAPVSVLLPTTDGSESACDIKNQLRPGDELVVICDSESDEIHQSVENDPEIELVVAGQPKGCSGKANAVAEGMETASNRGCGLD
jgi:hypothetical protein|nr:MAG: hypothetical protein J07AB56_06510 [Candidatus Nanosalinarum sp. J07AB56]